MKINTTIILTTIILSAATPATFAASDSYIPWTFDDFDSNCEVIDNTTTTATDETASLASDNYISWTFDDFDSNCEVID